MAGWVDKLEANMQMFLESGENTTPEQKLNFIRRQYVLLDTTVKVLNGKSYFTGCVLPPVNRTSQ
jgi:hypothetical protein